MGEKGRMKDRRKESICDGNDNGSNFVLDKAGLGREGTPPSSLIYAITLCVAYKIMSCLHCSSYVFFFL